MNSYSVRCIFDCPKADFNTFSYLYEERITVWNAEDIDVALDLASNEAESYAVANGFNFSGLAQAFWMFTQVSLNGLEVFSLLRESDLEIDQYIKSFFSNGHERQKKDDSESKDGESGPRDRLKPATGPTPPCI